MPAALSMDLRRRIIAAWQNGEGSWQGLSDRFGVGIATVNRLVSRFRTTGSVEPTRQKYGSAPLLVDKDLDVLERLVRERPDSTIAELVEALKDEASIEVSASTVGRAVRDRLGWTRKKSRWSRRSAIERR